ncbi:MAG: flavodoxin family protein [Clostridia bacterium]|nr:flavodoxin family protein [Clostridia bacterium]
MKIIIINGSNRKNGATYNILNELRLALQTFKDAEIEFYNVSELNLKYCIGCSKCYKTGHCVFDDDLERLSLNIASADGIILGSPTYASNVSAQIKTIIDRGHFVIEQLLYGKYAVSIATYENYGGKDTSKVLNKLLSYSGAYVSGKIICKTPFSYNPLNNIKLKNYISRVANRLHKDIQKKRKYPLQKIKRNIIFKFGILPFVKRKGIDYNGVLQSYKVKDLI